MSINHVWDNSILILFFLVWKKNSIIGGIKYNASLSTLLLFEGLISVLKLYKYIDSTRYIPPQGS
jgi:hypothetical protein